MKLNDDDLLLAISNDNEEAFKSLFRKYRDKLFAYIFKVTKSRETSEELVMDVFIKIWQSRAILTEIKNFQAFIFHIAKNKSLDFLRLAAKDQVLMELIWDEIKTESDSRSDEKLILTELKGKIEQVVDRLSPQRQSVFRLSREQNMTYDQIAVYFVVNGTQHYLTNDTFGIIVVQNNLKRVFEDYMYLQPIPYDQIVLNPKLIQNPEWAGK